MSIISAIRANFDTLLAEHIEASAEELTRLVRERCPALASFCSKEVTYANYLAAGYSSSPRCEVLDSTVVDTYLFRITSPPEASCLGIILGNDTNAVKHIGSKGSTQSNAIIGICTDAVMRALGGELLEVNPLTFRNSIPLGEPVLVEIVLTSRKQLTLATIVVLREHDRKVVLKKANLKMTPREEPT